MTEFDTIIEATRRGFLKQAAGALAASVTPITKTVTAAAPQALKTATYDIAAIVSSPETMQKIYTSLSWYDPTSLPPFDKWYGKIKTSFESGKGINDIDLIQHLIIRFTETDQQYAKSLRSMMKVLNGEDENTCLDSIYSYMDDDMEDAFDYILPADISYNGKIIYSKDSLLKHNIFNPAEDVKERIYGEVENVLQNREDFESGEAAEQHEQDVKDAEDTIKDTHSQLGIRRDSAWYESVLKEQDKA